MRFSTLWYGEESELYGSETQLIHMVWRETEIIAIPSLVANRLNPCCVSPPTSHRPTARHSHEDHQGICTLLSDDGLFVAFL